MARQADDEKTEATPEAPRLEILGSRSESAKTSRDELRGRVIRLVRDEGFTATAAAKQVGVKARTAQWWVRQSKQRDKWITDGRGLSKKRTTQLDAGDLDRKSRKQLRGAVTRMLGFLDSAKAVKDPSSARAAAQVIAILVDKVPNILAFDAMLETGDSAGREEAAANKVLNALGVEGGS